MLHAGPLQKHKVQIMPLAIRGVDDIMAARRRNTLFLELPGLMLFTEVERGASLHSQQIHFEWFRMHDITWEIAAPRGWLEGDPGIYFLHCEPDDAKIAEYSAEFENGDGTSPTPEVFQMFVLNYESWRKHRDQSQPLED